LKKTNPGPNIALQKTTPKILVNNIMYFIVSEIHMGWDYFAEIYNFKQPFKLLKTLG
jgi:hypothetical protein